MGTRRRVLLMTSAAPRQSPFSTGEKRPPLGVGFIISVLREAGHEVFFLDNYLRPTGALETDYLQRHNIEFVGLSANTVCYRDTLRMLHRLEYLRRSGTWKGTIIVGGPHATVAPDSIPSFVDHVVQGEGEGAVLDIVDNKVSDRIVRYPSIRNLDDLPMPAWDYFVHLPYKWSVDWFDKAPVFTMNTSRGCPFNCTFCSVGSIWGRQYTFFSPERIVADMEHLIGTYGARGFYFREDNFTLDKERLRRFCNLLLDKGISTHWACETRVNTLTMELVDLMHRAGARAFYFGVESGSQRILNSLKKGITTEQTRRAFQLCHEYGIKSAASIIVGVPTETAEDLGETAKLLRDIKPTTTWYNVFVGIPDSPLYGHIRNEGLFEYADDRGLLYLPGHNERVRKFYNGAWDAEVPYDSENPRISVVMSVHNGEKYVEAAARSVLGQTFQNFEFIIVDDGSTDATGDILGRLRDPRVRVVRNTANKGLTQSLNIGIGHARGKYVARMDADDLSLPHRFEVQMEFLENNPDFAVVGSSYYQIDEEGKTISLVNVLTEDDAIREGLKKQNWFGHGTVMIRREVLSDLGGYDERFKCSQDYDLWLRVSEKHKVANVGEPLYCWRSTGSSVSRRKAGEQRAYAEMALAEMNRRRSGAPVRRNGDPLISVIIPTYNRPTMLAEALESVLGQTFRDFEIVVVNDGGEGVEGLISPKDAEQPVTYVRHGRNRGLAATRNTGIRIARGEYVALLDDDDLFYPDHLETALAALREGHKVVYSDAVRATFAKEGGRYVLQGEEVPYSIDFDRNILLVGNIAPVNSFVFERQLALKAGLFDEGLSTLEDWEFWIRLSSLVSFKHVKKATVRVNWRTDGSTMTSSRHAEFRANRQTIYRRYRDELRKVRNFDDIAAMFQEIWSRDIAANASNKTSVKTPRKKMTSIVILTINELAYTKKCIDSIRRHTPEPHEIIFVDNGSTDGTVKWLRRLVKDNAHYRLIENGKNLGFAKGCNQGMEASSGEHVLLLNNDVIVTSEWLAGLLECLERTPDAGIVGPMTNNISGCQKVPGAWYDVASGLDAYAAAFRKAHRHRRIPMNRIVGFCMLFRRELADRIGGLDESFGSGNFEDDDFCLRAVLAGHRNVIAGDVFIHHFGSRSFIGNRIDYSSALWRNRGVFRKKWDRRDSSKPTGREIIVMNTLEKAERLYHSGKPEEAAAAHVEGLKGTSADPRIRCAFAAMLADSKQFAEALEILEGMTGTGHELQALALKGQCKEGLELYEEAGACAEGCLAGTATHAPALNLKGIIAHRRGDNEAAAAYFEEALRSDPGYGEPYTNMGVLQWVDGRREEAFELLEKGFVLSPRVADIATAYHSAATTLNGFARAEERFREVLALYPEDKRTTFFLIDSLLQQGNHDDALGVIERSLATFGADDGIVDAALKVRERADAEGSRPVLKGQATVSLCMIVKNEEEHLAQCLLSAKPVVDEMVVVDTGSTDRTRDIARVFGAKVYDFPWTGDFSEARNHAISQAQGDWILVLDADEVVSPRDCAALRQLTHKKNGRPGAFSFVTRNYANSGEMTGWASNDGEYVEERGIGWFPSTKVRLFTKDSRARFENPVHELLEPSLKRAGIQVSDCSVPIHHYGMLNREKREQKQQEYYELGRKKLASASGDPMAAFELGIQAAELGKYDEAIELYRGILGAQCSLKAEFRGRVYLNLGYALLETSRFDEALSVTEKALDTAPQLKEAVLNYSLAQFYAGDAGVAVETLQKSLVEFGDYPPAEGLLAVSRIVTGESEKGLEGLRRLAETGYNCADYLLAQARKLISAGRHRQALSLLEITDGRKGGRQDISGLREQCLQALSDSRNEAFSEALSADRA